MRSTAVSALALFFVAQRAAHGFSPSTTASARRAISTRRRFRHAADYGADAVVASVDQADPSVANFMKFPVTQPASDSILAERMPTWLRNPRPDLVEQNLAYLREAMVSSYLSESEAAFVLSAIEEASGGDPGKAAGAAEFCHILVDTMEMDVSTLVAGAFHYCTCVTARERSASLPPSEFSFSSFWDRHEASIEGDGVHAFGVRAAVISRDAARLKRTEAVAASVAAGVWMAADDADGSVNLRSLLLSETRDWRALAIRSAACLYRLRGLLRARGDAQGGRMTSEEVQTAKEALHIFAPLASRLGMHRLKNELEGAAFKIKYRRQYRKVMNISLEKRSELTGTLSDGLQSVLDEATIRVTEFLQEDPTFRKYADHITVSARVKEPFSLWRKMLKTGARHILDVPDAIALRVVLRAKKLANGEEDEVTRARERALCYYAQTMCVDRFEPLPGRFKDYIEQPKRNGYQSLHYTARAERNGRVWPFEVQIRSEEMHRVAEFGLASHWNYKDYASQQKTGYVDANANPYGSASSCRQETSLEAYLKSVQEWHWNRQPSAPTPTSAAGAAVAGLPRYNGNAREERQRARSERIAPYIEALSEAKSDLARDSVFVFLSSNGSESGKVLALPSGAVVLDALREGERRFGVSVDWRNTSEGRVEYNGAVSNITERLHNGDVIMVQSYIQTPTPTLSY